MTPPATASQTVGPFFHLGVCFLTRDHLTAQGITGEIVAIRGKVLDGDGEPVPDALLEFWQADAAGHFADDGSEQNSPPARFRGFGRVETDQYGAFSIATIKPGRVPFPDGSLQAPHIAVTVFARGLLKPLWTRIYFPDEPSNAADPVLKLVPPERQATLIARPSSDKGADGAPENAPGARFDWNVVMQGDGETVFFDY
jgi:protocatechuate 3,4-dioxygenase, alpha subunit